MKKELKAKNKGEWSEVLVLAHAIAYGSCQVVDSNLHPVPGEQIIIYEVDLGPEELPSRSYPTIKHPTNPANHQLVAELMKDIRELKNEIRAPKKGAFVSMPGHRILETLAADFSKTRNKTDIWLTLASETKSNGRRSGFSIKSALGGAPTLINASGATNFSFRASGGDIATLIQTSKKNDIRNRVKKFIASGGTLTLDAVHSENLVKNLKLIHPQLLDDIARMIVAYYSTQKKFIPDLIEASASNSLNEAHFRIRKFLLYCALGMNPGHEWDGYKLSHGGYIQVLENGEVCCLPATNDDQLADYLFENTKFETASTRRWGFGVLNQEDDLFESDKNFITLNLQVRFLDQRDTKKRRADFLKQAQGWLGQNL